MCFQSSPPFLEDVFQFQILFERIKMSFLTKFKEVKIISYAELWDRFNYYGLQALLILYLTHRLHLPDQDSYSIYGVYTALSFGFTILGGVIADHFLGFFRAAILGGLLISVGNVILVFSLPHAFYFGLAVIVVGIGLFKPNNPNLLGSVYSAESLERSRAFAFFYLCINIGSIVGPIFYGILSKDDLYWVVFIVSAAGMLSALLGLYFFGCNSHKNISIKKMHLTSIVILLLGCIAFSYFLLSDPRIFVKTLIIVSVIFIFLLFKFLRRLSIDERRSLFSLFIPIFACIIFFSSFLQIYSSLTLFIDRYVGRTYFGFEIPTLWFSSLEPLFIIILVPFFSILWGVLNRKNIEPHSKYKVIIGLGLAAFSFLIFAISSEIDFHFKYFCLILIILANAILAMSELCIIPVTMSLTNMMAPKKYRGTMMGVFYFSLTLSGYFSGLMAKLAQSRNEQGVALFSHTFNFIAAFLIFAAFILFVLTYILNKKNPEPFLLT